MSGGFPDGDNHQPTIVPILLQKSQQMAVALRQGQTARRSPGDHHQIVCIHASGTADNEQACGGDALRGREERHKGRRHIGTKKKCDQAVGSDMYRLRFSQSVTCPVAARNPAIDNIGIRHQHAKSITQSEWQKRLTPCRQASTKASTKASMTVSTRGPTTSLRCPMVWWPIGWFCALHLY